MTPEAEPPQTDSNPRRRAVAILLVFMATAGIAFAAWWVVTGVLFAFGCALLLGLPGECR